VNTKFTQPSEEQKDTSRKSLANGVKKLIYNTSLPENNGPLR